MKPRVETMVTLAIPIALWITASGCHRSMQERPDTEICTGQLQRIHLAIQAYRRDHKDLPDSLGGLIPKYLADTNALICPVTKRTGRTHPFEHLKDPRLP